jgi:hypothetical protein
VIGINPLCFSDLAVSRLTNYKQRAEVMAKKRYQKIYKGNRVRVNNKRSSLYGLIGHCIQLDSFAHAVVDFDGRKFTFGQNELTPVDKKH